MADVNTIILYILLGAIFGIVYSLRRIYSVEKKIDMLDSRIARMLSSRSRSTKKRKR